MQMIPVWIYSSLSQSRNVLWNQRSRKRRWDWSVLQKRSVLANFCSAICLSTPAYYRAHRAVLNPANQILIRITFNGSKSRSANIINNIVIEIEFQDVLDSHVKVCIHHFQVNVMMIASETAIIEIKQLTYLNNGSYSATVHVFWWPSNQTQSNVNTFILKFSFYDETELLSTTNI